MTKAKSASSSNKHTGGSKDSGKKLKGKLVKSHFDSEESSSCSDGESASGSASNSGLPKFHKGTTWPLDSTLEILVNYEAVKEVRTVKQDFYPLLYHLTRVDHENIAKFIASTKPIRKYLKDRFCTHTPCDPPEDKREMRSSSVLKRSQNEAKRVITELSEAKSEMLKLLSCLALRRQQFASLLLWMQRLELRGGGRWNGELHIAEGNGKQVEKKTAKPGCMYKNYKKVGVTGGRKPRQKCRRPNKQTDRESCDPKHDMTDSENEDDSVEQNAGSEETAKKTHDFRVLYNGKVFMTRSKRDQEGRKSGADLLEKNKVCTDYTRKGRFVRTKEKSQDTENETPPVKKIRRLLGRRMLESGIIEDRNSVMLGHQTRNGNVIHKKLSEKGAMEIAKYGDGNVCIVGEDRGMTNSGDCERPSGSLETKSQSFCVMENEDDVLVEESPSWMPPPIVQIENLEEEYEDLYLKVDDPATSARAGNSSCKKKDNPSDLNLKVAKVVLSDIMNSTLDEIYKATTGGSLPPEDHPDDGKVGAPLNPAEHISKSRNCQKGRMRLLPLSKLNSENGEMMSVTSKAGPVCVSNNDHSHSIIYNSYARQDVFRTLGLDIERADMSICQHGSVGKVDHVAGKETEISRSEGKSLGDLVESSKTGKTQTAKEVVQGGIDHFFSPDGESCSVACQTIDEQKSERLESNPTPCNSNRASPDTSSSVIKVETDNNKQETILITRNLEDVGCIEIDDDDDDDKDDDDSNRTTEKDTNNVYCVISEDVTTGSDACEMETSKEADAVIIIDDD